jgi:hypothetical protein
MRTNAAHEVAATALARDDGRCRSENPVLRETHSNERILPNSILVRAEYVPDSAKMVAALLVLLQRPSSPEATTDGRR